MSARWFSPAASMFRDKRYAQLACFLLLVICAAFALSYPLAMRTAETNHLFMGTDSYAALIQSLQPFSSMFSNELFFSSNPVPAPFSLDRIVYSILLHILPAWALPVLLALITLTIVWFVLASMGLSLSLRFVTACLFSFTPLFVSSQLVLGPQSLLFIGVSALLLALYVHARPLWCGLLALLLGLMGPDAVFVLALVLVFSQPREGFAPIQAQKRYAAYAAVLGLCCWLVFAILTQISWANIIELRGAGGFFVEFGALHGQSLLVALLSVFGIIVSWRRERRWQVVAALALIVWSGFFSAASLVAAGVISYFAARAFVDIWRSRWQHPALKIIVLACILIAVLTSYFVYTSQLFSVQPTLADREAYGFIAQNLPQDAIIFSIPQQGAFISYFTGRDVFISEIPESGAYEERMRAFQSILSATSLSLIVEHLMQWNISHVVIDPQLSRSESWREDKGGLPLFLRNKQAFTLMYDANGYQIYQVNTNLAKNDLV